MSESFRFERAHDIGIDAPPDAVLDYVSNPNSWPEWIKASHHIDSPDRPLQVGDVFRERWHTRTGEAILDWTVAARDHPWSWTAEANTDFIGRIVVRYDIEKTDGGCHFIRTVINPARPKPPTDEMVARIDEEAEISLRNIKVKVERRQKR